MTLYCLMNADDFALNKSCSNAIITSVKEGRLQATSVLAGGEDQASYDTLNEAGDVFINAHLNLLEGKALTEGGSEFGLTTDDNFFCLSLRGLLRKLWFSPKTKLLQEWIFKEFCCQIDSVYKHFDNKQIRIDGHLHIHTLPPLKGVIEKLLNKYSVCYIRTPYEIGYRYSPFSIENMKGNLRRQLLGLWAKNTKTLVRRHHLETADFFLGATASCRLTLDDIDRSLAMISRQAGGKDATIEIMIHPVVSDFSEGSFYKDSLYRSAHITPEREEELDLLLSDELIHILKTHNAVFMDTNN